MATAIVSTPDAPWQPAEITTPTTTAAADVRLTGAQGQTWRGFGGCFNEMAWPLLQGLTAEAREQVLRSLFATGEGCGFTACRMPIGANDYALDWYSHAEHPDDFALEHFSIARDHQYLIPYIQSARAIQPAITLFASPWSPPAWMKRQAVYNHGRLVWEPAYLDAYADYFVRFVQAYAELGIPIERVHVQNEPDSDQKFPSCVWTGERMRDFIRDHLGPRFAAAGLDTGIGAGTFERGDFAAWILPIMADPEAARHVCEIGFQWAGRGAVQRSHQAWPEMPLIQTENECHQGRNSWDDAEHVAELCHHYITNGVCAYTYWNMILPPGGHSTWGWTQNAMITIDGEHVHYNPEYHVLRHHTHAIHTGGVRQVVAGTWAGNTLCFRNPDGSTGWVLNNPLDEAYDVTLDDPGGALGVHVPAHAIVSVVA
jgi:glucosylceramidase